MLAGIGFSAAQRAVEEGARAIVISDIHANLEALSATMDKYKEHGVDQLVNLGDTVGYGASPNQCCSDWSS